LPIYEYECITCGNRFELRCSMSDSSKDVICPKCGAKDARRVFSMFASNSSSGTCTPTSGSG